MLAHFQPEAPFVLTVDAGPCGLGAVLAHRDADGRERPIAFASRSLTTSEKNYSQIQKEATAIIYGVKHFHQYLYGRQEPFILKTDHKPLLSIFGKRNLISVTAALHLQRYAIILGAYNYTVQYVDAKNNQIADYFSRSPLSVAVSDNDKNEDGSSKYFLFLDASVEPVLFDDIRRATAADSVLKTVIKYMNNGWPRKIQCKIISPYFHCKTDLEVIDGCLFRGHRIIIPVIYRDKLLKELHSAHFGIVKTKSAARSRMWWPGIDADIERWVGACGACSSVRSSPPRAPPAPWPRPPAAWHRIHIDYMSIGQAVYLIVVDAYSKWLECVHMDRGTSTNALIQKLKDMFSRFGVPYVIVSDNDVKISSAEFHTFYRVNGIEYLNSPIYHPASNGQAENSVKTCKKMFKCMFAEDRLFHKDIHEKLQGFLFDFRNTIHCATGLTPAMLMLGRNLRCRLDLILPQSNNFDKNTEQTVIKCKRRFQVGETVWAKWFIARKCMWSLGVVKKKIGNRMYEIYFNDYGTSCNRHVDQMRKYTTSNNSDVAVVSLSSEVTPGVHNESNCNPLPVSAPGAPSSSPLQSPSSAALSNERSSASPAPASSLEEREVQVTAGRDRNTVAISADNVRDQKGSDDEDWVEACEVMDDRIRPDEQCIGPNEDINPNVNTALVGRSKRPIKHVCYKKYFK